MNILTAFDTAFARKRERNWEKIYVLVDIHDTILKACYQTKEKFLYYPYAQPTLRMMTERDDICLILWSSCYDNTLQHYADEFCKRGIRFNYINCNPEVNNTNFQDFGMKLYFNVGIDDKFGFEPEGDWCKLWHYFKTSKS